ncbi:MAG TPA: invasin domain 3-containing protein [Candidatus Saccharimonadales bacterium]|jgi:adhesin/invasin|nr:invasin domain 3-containing protein [Candidatus Saccharimonadales bacterium]
MLILSTFRRRKALFTRGIIFSQIAVQLGVALTPFWATSVNAAMLTPQDDPSSSATAGHLKNLGQAIQSGSLNGMAAQQTTGLAIQNVEQWLQQFGTARVELGTDSRFKPHTGSLDLLLPLYSSESNLVFTQNGIRNVDGQFTGNVGLGHRHFTGGWMLGYNAFYDQNMSRGHKRIGSGVEAWRDYLKLSGNGYYRLSDWRNSQDVIDYDARPANGFDLRTEAWLPTYPALGARVMYEQYYGNEVALVGKDKRQSNPKAVTAGLSWTPVPLVSLTTDHKKGGSQSETLFGLQFNLQFGKSLTSQLDPASIDLKRTLAGSRMDLVERNNNIVLEYRKQEVIKLALPKTISGASGSLQPINYRLETKYGLDKITWNEAALQAAGGKVIEVGAGIYQVMMPAYVAGTANSYTLSGVAFDSRNNSSKAAVTTVKVTAPQVSAAKSNARFLKETIIADGQETAEMIITLASEDGTPVNGMLADLSLSIGEETDMATNGAKAKKASQVTTGSSASLSTITEQGNGVYQVILTSGTRPAKISVTPSLNKLSLTPTTITQISDAASAGIKDSDLTLVVDNVVADGSAQNQVQARITDARGNPVEGIEVSFTLSGSAQVAAGSSLTATSDKKGYVSIAFINIVAEVVTVVVTTMNGNSAKVDTTFVANGASAGLVDGSLTSDRTSAIANGSDRITYNVQVKDANGNVVSGLPVNWNTDGGELSAASSLTDKSGKAETSLTSRQAVAIQVSADLNNSASANAPLVHFTADSSNLDGGKSTLAASQPTIVANNTETSSIILTLKDANDNPVSGQNVQFVSSLTGTSVDDVIDNADGSYRALLKGTKAGIASVTVTVNGTALSTTAAQITLVGDASNLDAGKSAMSAAPATIVANNSETSSITLLLKDVNENPVSGQSVQFISNLTGTSVDDVVENGVGSYSATLTGNKTGVASITATVNGTALSTLTTQVTLTGDSSNLDAGKSTLAASKSSIVADNTDASTLTLALHDVNDNPVSGQTVVFASSLTDSNVSNVTDNHDGTYTALLSGTKSGVTRITVTVNGTTLGVTAAQVTLTADDSNLDADKSTLVASQLTIVADDTETSSITLTLKDVNNNLVSGQNVQFISSLTGTTVDSVIDNGDGSYSALLKGTKAGITSVTVTVNGAALSTTAAQVTLTADASNLDAGKSSMNATPVTIVANNTETSSVTLLLKDVNNNPVSGQSVQFVSDLTGSTMGNVVENGLGGYSTTLTGDKSGVASVTVEVNGTALGTLNTQVTLTGDASNLDAGKSTLAASKSSIVANNSDASTITLTLHDINDNPVSGQTVVFASSLTSSKMSSVTDNRNGTYTASLTGTKAGNTGISVTVNGTALGVTAAQVTLMADGSNLDASNSGITVTPATIVADNSETSKISVVLKDVNGNPVSGQTVQLISSLTGTSIGSITDNIDGSYSALLSGTKAGSASLSLRVNGTALAVTTARVSLIADASTARINSNIMRDRVTLAANNTEMVTYTATVKDAYDNPVNGQTIVWAGNPTSTTLGSSAPTNSAGQASVTLKGTREQEAIINASLNGGTPVNTPKVSFKMPEIAISGNQAITATDITNALANTEAVFANLYNGHWAPTITFPAATGLSGKSVKIINDATYNADITVNGTTFTATFGETYLYTSNGSAWVKK